MQESYNELFTRKLKKCTSKKDYKRLCKEMIRQLTLIDKIDENLWKIFASTVGEDVYPKALAMAIQMYVLEQQGFPAIFSLMNPVHQIFLVIVIITETMSLIVIIFFLHLLQRGSDSGPHFSL